MADEADLGNEVMEKWLQGRLEEFQHQLGQMGNEVEEEQVCRNCREPLPPGRKYCDKDCAEDYEARRKAEKRRGKQVE